MANNNGNLKITITTLISNKMCNLIKDHSPKLVKLKVNCF